MIFGPFFIQLRELGLFGLRVVRFARSFVYFEGVK